MCRDDAPLKITFVQIATVKARPVRCQRVLNTDDSPTARRDGYQASGMRIAAVTCEALHMYRHSRVIACRNSVEEM